jgi:hypothetical protein
LRYLEQSCDCRNLSIRNCDVYADGGDGYPPANRLNSHYPQSLLLISCSHHKETSGQETFDALTRRGARSFHECLSSSARALLLERRKLIRALLKGSPGRLYNADQKGGFRDERACNRRLVDGPEFGGNTPGEAIYLPAYQRYSEGRFYSQLMEIAPSFWETLPESVEIIVVSALYGLLLWDEPIQDYDCHFADFQDDVQRTSIRYIWGDTLTLVLGDFLKQHSSTVSRIYDLLSESTYQEVIDWRDVRNAPVYHRIFRGVSGADTLAPLAKILATGVAKFAPESGSYEYGWFSLETGATETLEFGFEAEVGVDDRATREPIPEQEEIQRLEQSLTNERAELREFLDELTQVERERDQADGIATSERTQSDFLRRRLEKAQERISELERELEDAHIPQDLVQFGAWCREKIVGRGVTLLKRAYDGVNKSRLHDPALIYRSLLLLRDKYVPMRRKGGDGLRLDFERACLDLGLEETPTFSADPASRERAHFSVIHGGLNRLLDRHLKKGVSYEPKYCFRVYFFWDETSQQVVVGWLPSHLQAAAVALCFGLPGASAVRAKNGARPPRARLGQQEESWPARWNTLRLRIRNR